jgi:hypothetical protein
MDAFFDGSYFIKMKGLRPSLLYQQALAINFASCASIFYAINAGL